jgi:hypothetical protein
MQLAFHMRFDPGLIWWPFCFLSIFELQIVFTFRWAQSS